MGRLRPSPNPTDERPGGAQNAQTAASRGTGVSPPTKCAEIIFSKGSIIACPEEHREKP
jgi:hypothetical protein